MSNDPFAQIFNFWWNDHIPRFNLSWELIEKLTRRYIHPLARIRIRTSRIESEDPATRPFRSVHELNQGTEL